MSDCRIVYEKRVDGTVARKRLRGRPRKLVSLGRYPWIQYSRAFMEASRAFYSPRTAAVMQRGLSRVGDIFLELRIAGKVTTTNPKKLRLEDVLEFLAWMRTCPTKNGNCLRSSTQESYFGYLISLLRWVENPVLDEFKTPSFMRFPRKVPAEVTFIPEAVLSKIRNGLKTMPGWDGSVARFMVDVYAFTGMRISELRLARFEDLGTKNWRILVVHPKGDGVWASSGTVTILPPARQGVLNFLAQREEYLSHYGVKECEALVPKVRRSGEVGYWSDGMWGDVKGSAEAWVKTRFRIQDLRATFAQMCKDRGASIEAVSRALRHRTSRTTELYYARMRPEKAFHELEDLFGYQ